MKKKWCHTFHYQNSVFTYKQFTPLMSSTHILLFWSISSELHRCYRSIRVCFPVKLRRIFLLSAWPRLKTHSYNAKFEMHAWERVREQLQMFTWPNTSAAPSPFPPANALSHPLENTTAEVWTRFFHLTVVLHLHQISKCGNTKWWSTRVVICDRFFDIISHSPVHTLP